MKHAIIVAASRAKSLVRKLASFDQHDLGTSMNGIVRSPLEAASMRALLGPDTLLVVPGIRSAGVDAGDRKRISTPRQAMRILEEIG